MKTKEAIKKYKELKSADDKADLIINFINDQIQDYFNLVKVRKIRTDGGMYNLLQEQHDKFKNFTMRINRNDISFLFINSLLAYLKVTDKDRVIIMSNIRR
jgi:hypothetical protein